MVEDFSEGLMLETSEIFFHNFSVVDLDEVVVARDGAQISDEISR